MNTKHILLLISFIIISLFVGCSTDSDSSAAESTSDGQGGSLATFILKNDYLYTVDSFDLTVFNIKEVKNPVEVNSINVGFNIETLFNYQDFLFIGSSDAMFIYDITNAELPKLMSRSDHFRSCDPVVANDTNAYVTLHTNSFCDGLVNELRTYNIEDVEAPVLLNTRNLKEPKGLSLFGTNYLLVCDDTVKIFDVSDPNDSKFIKEIPTKNAIDIIIRDNHAFIISAYSIEQYELNNEDIENFKKISTFNF
ncbi:hypothetical protein ABW636_20795 [Aquimarina sp. 2201CG1-2-11]|uniref:hypothetical protein n=1 Tax=Aquimarina discodermiae TaxID=3231043 RepID=UPI0034618341